MEAKRVQSGIHFMLGNYALVEGALSAGCNFFGGYPITPANEISEMMSQRLPALGGQFVQGEDELFSIFACAGASLAGAKAMTATASAGYNYMQEGLEYCYAIEAPVVVADVQRCRGENYASQADVMQMRWGVAGDYEAVVVCPSSVQELYDYAIWAFNIAEEYRNPVIIMSETTIALMRERLLIPDEKDLKIVNRRYTTQPPGPDFLPFGAKENACPDFAPLAKGYNTVYSINPHSERGSIDWDPDVFEGLCKRITGKIKENSDKICKTEAIMLEDAEYALVAYGSEVRPCVEAAQMARESGLKMGVLKLCNVWPTPEKAILETARQVAKIFSVEMNLGKYGHEIQRVAARHCDVGFITHNRGIAHTPIEIYNAVKEGVK